MKNIRQMKLDELAACVCSHLEKRGISVVLSGGSCVSICTVNRYVSMDLDFINLLHTARRRLKSACLL